MCVYIYRYICIYIRMYMHTHTHTYTYLYLYIYISVSVYLRIYNTYIYIPAEELSVNSAPEIDLAIKRAARKLLACIAYVSIRQHTSAYVIYI